MTINLVPPPSGLNPPTITIARTMWWRGTTIDEIAWLLSLSPLQVCDALFTRIAPPVMRPILEPAS